MEKRTRRSAEQAESVLNLLQMARDGVQPVRSERFFDWFGVYEPTVQQMADNGELTAEERSAWEKLGH